MLTPGIFLFFLVPGLLAYCALYGLFHSGKAIAPEPPAAHSVEAVTVILLAAVAVHVASAVLIAINSAICYRIGSLVSVPMEPDIYVTASKAMSAKQISADELVELLGASLAQGILAVAGIRAWLSNRARKDKLPAWIYGWATSLANSVDNDDTLVLAYVLTALEADGKPVLYVGTLYDMALKPDGAVSRITLYDCERYVADLSAPLSSPTLPVPLSSFPFMIVEAENIRNIAFDVVSLAP
ncbi:hypothetical protein ACUXST_000136 [Sphingomonas sp. F9_3S_D5_B_2]